MGASGSTQKPANASNPSTNGSMNALKVNAPPMANASANVAKNSPNANNSNNSNVKVGGKRKNTRRNNKNRKNTRKTRR